MVFKRLLGSLGVGGPTVETSWSWPPGSRPSTKTARPRASSLSSGSPSAAGAKDKGDLDPLSVAPLPVQEAVLEALGQLGFRTADLEYGRIGGTGQRLPFYQEIELSPPPQYAHAVNEIEATFLASPDGLEVALEADKRGGSSPRATTR